MLFVAMGGCRRVEAGSIGRKLPTIIAGLETSVIIFKRARHTYMLYMSLLMVNEKQHLISGSPEFGSGFFKEHVVKMAFWLGSKAIWPNFSQYDTNEFSAMISWSAMLP